MSYQSGQSSSIPAVICLLSALRFHEIGTEAPPEVWAAIDRRAAQPRIKYPKVNIVRYSGKSLTAGVERHTVGQVKIRAYSPVKTVADCFKYRNKIGLEVALEALREVMVARRSTTEQIWHFAKICRVTETMRPYMEALV